MWSYPSYNQEGKRHPSLQWEIANSGPRSLCKQTLLLHCKFAAPKPKPVCFVNSSQISVFLLRWWRICLNVGELWSLGQDVPLDKEMATHSSILAWEIPWTEEPGGLQSIGLPRVWYDWRTEHAHTWRGIRDWYVLQHGQILKHLCQMKAVTKKSHIIWFHFQEMLRIGKSIEIKIRLLIAGEKGNREWLLDGYEVSF